MKVTTQDHPNAHILLDGVDISADCFEADDVAGYAMCYVRETDPNKGTFRMKADRTEMLTEKRTGSVTIKL